MSEAVKKVSTVRVIAAFLLDFFTAFFIFGYIVAKMTGNVTANGFSMQGTPALMAIALVIAYFIAGKYLGGTLWQRVIKTK